MQARMAVGFVDLENAYGTVPREMVMATVRWMGVSEAEARMVEVMYERTKGRVVVESGLSEEFSFNIGLRQVSALCPLLFIMVMELISRKISTKDVLRKMIYARGRQPAARGPTAARVAISCGPRTDNDIVQNAARPCHIGIQNNMST